MAALTWVGSLVVRPPVDLATGGVTDGHGQHAWQEATVDGTCTQHCRNTPLQCHETPRTVPHCHAAYTGFPMSVAAWAPARGRNF